jgi:hypothetical protein
VVIVVSGKVFHGEKEWLSLYSTKPMLLAAAPQ